MKPRHGFLVALSLLLAASLMADDVRAMEQQQLTREQELLAAYRQIPGIGFVLTESAIWLAKECDSLLEPELRNLLVLRNSYAKIVGAEIWADLDRSLTAAQSERAKSMRAQYGCGADLRGLIETLEMMHPDYEEQN